MEVNPLLKYDTSVPPKYYTGAVESQEPIEGFWDEGVVFCGFEGLKYRDIETQRHGEHREERGEEGRRCRRGRGETGGRAEGRRGREEGRRGGPRGKPEVGQGLCVRAFQSGERKRRGGRECLRVDDRKSV
jgi:hypothetical protein